MARDARMVLNKKRMQKKQQQQQQQHGRFRSDMPTPRGFVDARQVLKQRKRVQGIQTSTLRSRNFQRNTFSNQRTFNKPFQRPFVPGRQRFTNQLQNRNFSNRPRGAFNRNFRQGAKVVRVPQSGILQVTSRNRADDVVSTSFGQNRFISNSARLIVTTNNRSFPANAARFEPVDNNDEMEVMTLEDVGARPGEFQALQRMGRMQQAAVPQSTLFSRLAKTVTPTMVADTISTEGTSTSNWKIMVSNLHSSVTEKDIMELFSYVGIVKSAEIVQPGSAVIEYYSKDDAMKAHDMYHKRLLDGIPMQVLVQCERRTPIAARLGQKFEGNMASAPLQRRTSSSYFNTFPSSAPRKVAFTVQVP